MSNPSTDHPQHGFLSALSSEEWHSLLPCLRPVELPLGRVIYQEGEMVETLYLLREGVVSNVLTSCEGVNVEVGIVGAEGIVGGGAALAGSHYVGYAVMQAPGRGWQISATDFLNQFARGGEFSQLTLRHLQALFAQAAQCVLCNRLHPLEARLCRWMLMISERVHSDTIHTTHEYIADMLGVRRAGVTEALITLRAAGLIDYQRGVVTILDRLGTEENACECYSIIRAHYHRLLGKCTGHREHLP